MDRLSQARGALGHFSFQLLGMALQLALRLFQLLLDAHKRGYLHADALENESAVPLGSAKADLLVNPDPIARLVPPAINPGNDRAGLAQPRQQTLDLLEIVRMNAVLPKIRVAAKRRARKAKHFFDAAEDFGHRPGILRDFSKFFLGHAPKESAAEVQDFLKHLCEQLGAIGLLANESLPLLKPGFYHLVAMAHGVADFIVGHFRRRHERS